MKNKGFLSCFICAVLCCVLVFNASNFRKDVQAAFVVDDVIITIEVGEILVTIGEVAVVSLAGILAGYGITSDNTEDEIQLTKEWLEYDIQTNGLDHTEKMLKDAGFTVNVGTDGSVTVDVPEQGQVGWIYVAPDTMYDMVMGKITLGEHTEPTGDNGGGGNGDDDGGNNGDDDGSGSTYKRLIAGFMAGVHGVTTIGNSLYGFLHSDSVEYIENTSFVAEISNYDNIRQWFCDWQNSVLNAYFGSYASTPYAYEVGDGYNMQSYSSTGCTSYPYIDIYFKFYPDNEYMSTVYNNVAGVVLFAVVFHNADDSKYHISTRSSYIYKDGTSSTNYFYSNDALMNDFYNPKYNSTLTFSEALNKILGFNVTSNFGVCVNDLNQVAHFFNSDYVSDEDLSADTDTGSDSSDSFIKIGDRTYTINQGDNIYNNPSYVTQQITNQANDDGKILVTVPDIDEDGNISFPTYVTTEGETGEAITFVNPDDVGLKTDVALSDEDYTNKNIFQLLYNFCTNFWTKFKQLLTNTLTTLFVPDLSSFEATFDSLKAKFPIVEQVDVLLNKLINYDYDSTAPPSFLIKYKTSALNYETPDQAMIDFSEITSFISILHGIILFIAYYCFGKKVVGKLTKVFQP